MVSFGSSIIVVRDTSSRNKNEVPAFNYILELKLKFTRRFLAT
jgi:hypothetical protein